MQHDNGKSELLQARLPAPHCDQCQLIGATKCCQACGCRLQAAACVTALTADDLVEWGERCLGRASGEQSGDTRQLCCVRQRAASVGGRASANANERPGRQETTMIIESLVKHASAATHGCDRWLGLALAPCALLLLLCATATTTTTLAGPVGQTGKFLDASCNSLAGTNSNSQAFQVLLLLRCDIAPLYDRYAAAYQRTSASEPTGGQLAAFRQTIEPFFEAAREVLELREFCSWNTFSKLGSMKSAVASSQLLTLAYDLVAVELHTSCLEQTIARLPPVPHLVKDIVKIYIDGADKPLPDLNAPAESDMDVDDDTPFDVEAAIEQNGSLEDVVGLSLSMFGRSASNQETAQEFRTTCKNFLIGIEQRWDTMEIMNSVVATDGSAIRQVNNYALRTLAPTKFADICSKISARA